MPKYLILFFVILLFTNMITFAQSHQINSEDFYQMNEILDCQVSPDGELIAYVLRKVDQENNGYVSNIWLIPAKGGHSSQLTRSLARDTSPRWSPDSKYISFVSDRSGNNQIWMINITGGEAWTLTNLSEGATHPSWSPDASKIAFLSPVSGEEDPDDDVHLNIKNHQKYANDVLVINHLKYRYGTKFFTNRYTHIFVTSPNGRNTRQLTFGRYHDADPSWSPDSRFIAFSSNRQGDLHLDDNTDIYLISSEGGEVKQITSGVGPESHPEWSRDGMALFYSKKAEPNSDALQYDIWFHPLDNRQTVNLTRDYDGFLSAVNWTQSGQDVFFLAPDQGNVHLYSVSISNSKIRKIIRGRRELETFSISSKGKIAFIASDGNNPDDLFLTDISGNNEKRLTKINDDFLQSVRLSEPEEFYFKSYDSTTIHGWIMKPVPFHLNVKYPLILQIHGGPYWHYGNGWSLEFQILAAQGYAIFYCNPRLSTGYGQQFASLGTGQWGSGDYEDIMAGIDHVIGYDYIDSTKMGITGGSYGGYMTNWIIGHTHRFKAAVTQRSITNLISFYGTTDIQSFVEFEFGLPWKNFSKFYDQSPITYVERINTPLLILHSEFDYRVPISQAEELFTLLKRRGVEVEFVRYPREGHDLSRSGQPIHRVDRYNRIVVWFNRYLK